MAKATSAKTPIRTAKAVPQRRAATIEMVRLQAPSDGQIEKIIQAFGLNAVDAGDIHQSNRALIEAAAGSLADGLGERGMQIHMQRIVGAFVGSAYGAGEHYSNALSAARDATAKLSNDERDHDRDGPVGFDSRAQSKREFAATMALQSYCLLAAAEGAVAAYEQVIGEPWKPFERAEAGPSVDRQAAAAQMSAFG